MVMFMIIGEKSYKLLHKGIDASWKATILTLVGLLVFIILAYISNAKMDLNIGKVPSVWWLYSIPFAGYCMVYGMSWLTVKYGGVMNKPLLWLGRNSLLVMCLHEPIKRIVIKVFAIALHGEADVIRQSLSISILIAITVLLVCYPLAYLISRKMAWMIGKKNFKTNKL